MLNMHGKLTGLITLAAITVSVSFPGSTVRGADQGLGDLKRYQERYSAEIFDYCLDVYVFDPELRLCLRRQQKIKDNILAITADRLGDFSAALAVYDGCMEYYPIYGVARIGECVYTRLMLHEKLDDDVAEQQIYRKCELKWRDNGYLAIRNCSANSANYYREKGRFRDW